MGKINKKILLLGVFLAMHITGVDSVFAQTSCLLYPSNSTPPGMPNPYGASWDVTSPGKELLVKSTCPTSGNNITITVGKGNTSQFIWQHSYVYNTSLTPPKWATTTLDGTVDANGWITSGSGTKTITTPFTASASNPLFFVGYVCTYHDSRWKCGCRDSSCTSKYWQLQAYKGAVGGGSSCPAWKNDIVKNPFNKNSIYHIPLASGITYAGDTDPTTIAWKSNSFGNFKIGCSVIPVNTMAYCDENAHPIFIAPLGTPTVTVGKLAADANSLPATVRMPDEAKLNLEQGAGKDATISIFYPDTNQVYVFYKYSWNGGAPTAQRHVNYPANGTGHPNYVGDGDVGTIAAGVANWLGTLRGHEVAATGQDFNHRFKIAVSRKDNQGVHILGRGFHLPANGTDGGITPDQNLGPFSYGDIVALPQSVNIDSLGLSEPGKRFARAMQQYGILLVDGGPEGIRGDQYINLAARNLMTQDFRTIWDLMRRVEDFTTNAEFDQSIAAGKIGPGTPLGPNCAFDAL